MALFVLAMLLGCAVAETEPDIRCWTANEDAYYHMDRSCGGNTVPISESAALAFGKKPCGRCVIVEEPEIVYDDNELYMATRGGTYILCIPVGSTESAEQLPELERAEKKVFAGEEIEPELRNILAEKAYVELMDRFEADGWVRDSCRVPEPVLEKDALFMSRRLIDEEWYFALRPEKGYGAEISLKWRVDEWEIEMESYGQLTLLKSRSDERVNAVSIADHSGAEVLFEKNYGDVEITVYRNMGMNTAVLRDSSLNRDLLTCTLTIGEADTGVVLNGYLDGSGKATYCCVISDMELGNLVAGKSLQVKYNK